MNFSQKKFKKWKNHKIGSKNKNKDPNYNDCELSSITIDNYNNNKSCNIYETYRTDYGCKNIQGISDFFEVSSLKNQIACTESVSVFNIQIFEDFTELCAVDLDQLSVKCSNKSVIIFLSSKSNSRFLIYWKSKDIRHFLILKHYKDDFMADDRNIYQFIVDFLANSLSRGKLGVYKKYSISPSTNQIDIHLLADIRNYNLLPLAAESGNADVVKILLQIGMDTETPDESINAQSLAWKGQHSEVILLLVEANLPYPIGIDADLLSENFKKFYKRTVELHAAIKDMNVERVKEIVTNNKNLKFFFNLSNVSAAKYALTVKAFEIYELLLIYEIFLAPHEYKQKVFNDLTKLERRSVREIHNKHSKDLPDKHINVLMAHSFVGHNVPDAHHKLQHVYSAYKSLSQDERLNTILKVVAASRKLRIIYDFNMNSVDVADPTASEYTEGVFYISGRIYIGAKQLLSELNQHKAIATIAHELCHFAMNLVYENSAKPYYDCDFKSYKEFKNICKNYEKIAEKEPIIKVVYDFYKPEVYHAELIVRPPHMIAFYKDQPEKLQEIKNIYPKLFDYYENKVIAEMLKALPDIDKRDEKRIKKKYKKMYRNRRNVMLTIVFSIFGIIVILILVAVPFIQPLMLTGVGNSNEEFDGQLGLGSTTYSTTLDDYLIVKASEAETKSYKATAKQHQTTTKSHPTTLKSSSTTIPHTTSSRSFHIVTQNHQRHKMTSTTKKPLSSTTENPNDSARHPKSDIELISEPTIKSNKHQNIESIPDNLQSKITLPNDDKIYFPTESPDKVETQGLTKILDLTSKTSVAVTKQAELSTNRCSGLSCKKIFKDYLIFTSK